MNNARYLKWRVTKFESLSVLACVLCPDCVSQTASDDPMKNFLKDPNGFP
jgi:hypothetical protein